MSASSPGSDPADAIAIIGLACRFPGARDVDEFWRNLCAGVESIRSFTAEELRAAGVPAALLARPDYVRVNAVLEGADRFDAAFFGYAPREAELLDPQQRLFLECAWSALEHAGWNPLTLPGATGVFAGSGLNTYLLRQIAPNTAAVESAGGFSVMIANDKDFLPTRVAYKLDLRGPAVAVQTACSTSLVAVHLAAQSLLGGECDAAVAGGVSIRFPQVSGYVHQEGMILSPDGHCRAFDARAAGTVGGNGVGAVVLKRLADALADGDTIHAVIRGSAINNDGAGKVGYTAPSAVGQEAVIAEALAVAGVEPASVGYVEAHGTATSLGDPIEVAALTRAFQRGTDRRQFCALGSVKTNFGHLDAAAGIAGLIKAVLALKHGAIPPSLHFTAPNPAIDFAVGPFRVAATLESWPRGSAPRRAGVSSFGIGGTNAHVVLEEAPARAPVADDGTPQLLILSARTETALARAAENLAEDIAAHPDRNLADVAYTLAVGRREFACRRFVAARSGREGAAMLRGQAATVNPGATSREFASVVGSGINSSGLTPLLDLGRSWAAGTAVDWADFYAGSKRRRVPLPTYPFEGERHWIESAPPKKPDLADWFYLPAWKTSPAPASLPALTDGAWVIFGDGLGSRLAARLRSAGAAVVEGRRDYVAALARLRAAGSAARWIVHAGNVGTDGADGPADLIALIEALGAGPLAPDARLIVVADGLCHLPGETASRPDKALLLGPVRVLPRENPGLDARAVDVAWPAEGDGLVDPLLAEARRGGSEPVVALRGRRRWVQAAEPARLEGAAPIWRLRGTYLITGGLGGIGAVLAQDLARRAGARLILTGRTVLPARGQWAAWRAAHAEGDATSARLRRIEAIEAAGGEVFVGCANAADLAAMRHVVTAARARFGEIHGVIHAAGLPGAGAMARRSPEAARAVLAPKVAGTRVLGEIFRDTPLDFFALMSSLSAQLGEFGQADYASANAFLDSFAQSRRAAGAPLTSIAWDAWGDTGMAARLAGTPGLAAWAASRRPFQITDEEGVEIFHRAVAAGVPHVIVSTHDLEKRVRALNSVTGGDCRIQGLTPAPLSAPAASSSPRPELATPFAAPATETERGLAAIWEELLGVAPVGAQDDFFELGGHSLLATQVIARLRERGGASLALPAFFAAPTVAALAQMLDTRPGAVSGEPALAPAPRTGPLPLSYQQQALWLLDRMDGRSAQMNELGAQTIRGPLDAALLRRSLAEVVRRHEALRTRLVERGGEPVQEIMAELEVDLPLTDLSAEAPAVQEASLRRLAADLVAQAFDLARGPLLRAALVRRGAGQHVVLAAVHHIVFDGWSASVFFREMVSIYANRQRGTAPELPPLPVQYADYAVWQRAMLRGSERERLAAFWREQLGGRPAALALPTDHPRPSTQAFRGEKHRVEIDAALTRRLEELGRGLGASLFMTVLAAYGALLGRYAGQDDVTVGCPTANRGRREVEPLIGFFVNPLPMRLDLRGAASFAALLARVRATVLAAYEHQALPFELMVEAVQPPRDPGRHVIFQTMLSYQNAAPAAPVAPGLVVEPLEFPEGPARTDLDLYLWEGPEGLRGYFIYDTALFAAPTVARLALRWRTLLESAVENPAGPLSVLRLDRAAALPALPRLAARPAAATPS